MIDHILLLTEFLDNVTNAVVLTDHAQNMSDHSPVICSLTVSSNMEKITLDRIPRIAWDKAINSGKITDYTFAVSQSLWTLSESQSDIEIYYNILIEALINASTETVPFAKFNKHLKPYWNKHLSTLHREVMRLRNL